MLNPSIELVSRMWFLYALLTVVGFGFRSFFGRRNKDAVFSCVPTPLIGMTVILVCYWYGLVFLKTGVDPLTVPIVVTSIALALWFGFSERKQLLKRIQGSLAQGVALSLSTFIFLVQWRSVLSDGGFMRSVTGNNDIILYAQIAEHMGRNSFDSFGRIGGMDSGYTMEASYSGAFEFIAFARSVMSASFNDTLLPVLGVVFLLVAHSLTLLLRHSTKLNRSTVGCLAVVPQSVFMVAYLGGSYFLAQMMATALFISLVTVGIKMQLQDFRFRDVIGPKTVIGGLLFSSLFLTYPHMGFILVPILGSFLIWRLPVRESIFRLVSLFSMAAFGSILVIRKMTSALEKFRLLAGDIIAGWPLPGFLPSQLIGLQWSEKIPPTNQDWILSGLLILTFVWTVLILRRRDGHTLPLLPVVPILLCSYAVVYFISGVSYKQWKWITFFQPLLVVAILLPIVAVFAASQSRHLKSVLITNGCLILLVGMNLWSTRPFQQTMGQISKQVNSELVNLGKNPKLANIDELNVKSGPYSGSMWPALYLAPRRINILDPSYYTSAEPLSAPTLVRNDFSLHESVPADQISSDFKLVRYPDGLISKDKQGLASRATIDCPTFKMIIGQVVTCDLELTNIGDATWLGSGNFQGAVNVGVRIVDPISRKPISEIARAYLPGFPNYVSPEATRRIQFTVSFDKVGTVLIEVAPVSEFVAWFADLNFSNASYLELTISE